MSTIRSLQNFKSILIINSDGANFSKCVKNMKTKGEVDWNRNPLNCKCRRDSKFIGV